MIQWVIGAFQVGHHSRSLALRTTCNLVLCSMRQAKVPWFQRLEQIDRSQARRERVSSMFRDTNNGNWCSIDYCIGSRKPSASLAQNPTRTSTCLAYQG